MDKNKIIELLKEYESVDVERYASYCLRLFLEKNRNTGAPKNAWMQKRSESALADLFKRVALEGLVLDGEHVTLQSTGVTYDYIAYKNKMYIKYPESIIDVSLVFKGDTFNFKKVDGQIEYSHDIGHPFNQKDSDVEGAYCVIKNRRGEFITLLSGEDLVKHRKVAKTDYIWSQWFKEMCLKTIIKKACKQHFADIYQSIDEMDNENYDLDNPLDLDLKYKQEIEAIQTKSELQEYYSKNKGKGKGFDKLVADRNKQLTQAS
jgi:hypothetical protein